MAIVICKQVSVLLVAVWYNSEFLKSLRHFQAHGKRLQKESPVL